MLFYFIIIRGMVASAKFAEIIEAIKQLEEAVIIDTGITR